MITNEMYQIHLQSIRKVYVKLSLLQGYFINEEGKQVRRFKKVGEIQGNATGGNINIDANSAVRRTCSIDLKVSDSSFLISEDSKIWIDKLFRVEIGIKNLISGNIVWFNKGIYAINKPSVKYSATEKTLHIEGLDMMCFFNGVLGGNLEMITKIPAETPISDAIKSIVTTLGKISKNDVYIEHTPEEIPFDIEKNAGDTIYSLLEEIRDLFMSKEIFFDESGRFIYQTVKGRYVKDNPSVNDIISYSFLEDNELAIDYDVQYDFENVKNKIIVWGKLLDNGIQIRYELENTNPDSPFNIDKSIGIVPFVFVDEKIFTEEQAEARANYEFYRHNNICEAVSISCMPLYFLDVNKLIKFNKPEINLQGKFLVDSISIPLNYDGVMSLSCHKIYPM